MPVAAYCWLVPSATDRAAGVTAIDTSTAGPTARVVLLLTLPDVALIVEVPSPVPLARPLEVMVATATFDDAQETLLVASWVPPSV